jgi:signal transduction histidine kinase
MKSLALRSLYLRIWLTVLAVLALFALASGWMWHRHLDQERARFEAAAGERVAAWTELIQRSLPGVDAAREDQAEALRDLSRRLRVPMALHDAAGERIAASEFYLRREAEGGRRATPVHLSDGRTLWLMRPGPPRTGPIGDRPWQSGPAESGPGLPPDRGLGAAGTVPMAPLAASGDPAPRWPRLMAPPGMAEVQLRPHGHGFDDDDAVLGLFPFPGPPTVGLIILLGALFLAVAGGAYPVVRRLTRRLEALQRGVETFGAGALSHRVAEEGSDEVAAVAATFNRTAQRIEALVESHRSLLANASHELRSPLARLKMALAMVDDAAPGHRAALRREIDTDIGELDALVEEVLLASRLDAAAFVMHAETVELLAVAVEEAARVGAEVDGEPISVAGDERLLRRALRNLLENARRYGGAEVHVGVARVGAETVEIRVSDRGPGVPADQRERIFEPFYRLPGHAEREGGVGLGLSLVRQIAQRHGGSVRCESRDGGGSSFVLSLPA